MFQFVRRTISDGVRKFTKGKSINPLRMYSTPTQTKKNTILDLQKKYREGKPITMVTAYDYTSAYITDQAGIDALLVGDSLGTIIINLIGYQSILTKFRVLIHFRSVSSAFEKFKKILITILIGMVMMGENNTVGVTMDGNYSTYY